MLTRNSKVYNKYESMNSLAIKVVNGLSELYYAPIMNTIRSNGFNNMYDFETRYCELSEHDQAMFARDILLHPSIKDKFILATIAYFSTVSDVYLALETNFEPALTQFMAGSYKEKFSRTLTDKDIPLLTGPTSTKVDGLTISNI